MLSHRELSDNELWEALREDDADAFTGLIRTYSRFLINYGRKFTSDSELIKDCIQDLFADIWLYRKTLSMATSVHTYLLVSLRRKILRATQSGFTRLEEADNYPFMVTFSIHEQHIEAETERHLLQQLNEAINSLPAKQKEVLYLKFYQNLSHYEIADLLNMQYQSVSNLIQRALAYLRKNWPKQFILLLNFCLIF